METHANFRRTANDWGKKKHMRTYGGLKEIVSKKKHMHTYGGLKEIF